MFIWLAVHVSTSTARGSSVILVGDIAARRGFTAIMFIRLKALLVIIGNGGLPYDAALVNFQLRYLLMYKKKRTPCSLPRLRRGDEKRSLSHESQYQSAVLS
ncbi:hypothetical protein GGS21DRAFT_152573 [Xylaria nigripes]|nr:hypothetical protein GGS21DRAFT_152573 [Xylaria nigripes]